MTKQIHKIKAGDRIVWLKGRGPGRSKRRMYARCEGVDGDRIRISWETDDHEYGGPGGFAAADFDYVESWVLAKIKFPESIFWRRYEGPREQSQPTGEATL